MQAKFNYLNIGCGKKYHKEWVNLDLRSDSPHVVTHDILKGLPFPDGTFKVVYHSQVLEHIPKDKALAFLRETYRVLEPFGITRIVVPDLEDIVNQYTELLPLVLTSQDETIKANYEWILMEMYDQAVRNYSGGQMARYLSNENIINERYVLNRIGFIGRSFRMHSRRNSNLMQRIKQLGFVGSFRKCVSWFKARVISMVSEKYSIGNFRLGGEPHMWMYDRYSLPEILKQAGYIDIKIKNAFESDIANWASFELDVKGGMPYDPKSLFVEGTKG